MSDHYLGKLSIIEKEMVQETSIMMEASAKLDTFTEKIIGEPLSWKDYLKLLQLTYIKYGKGKGHSGKTYILLRMSSVLQAKKNKLLRRFYPLVDSYEGELEGSLASFLKRQNNLAESLWLQMYRILCAVNVFLFMIVLVLLVFGLKLGFFWALFLSVLLWAGLQAYIHFWLCDALVQLRLEQMMQSLDPMFFAFEKTFVKSGLELARRR
jgi:hypothetical protein